LWPPMKFVTKGRDERKPRISFAKGALRLRRNRSGEGSGNVVREKVI